MADHDEIIFAHAQVQNGSMRQKAQNLNKTKGDKCYKLHTERKRTSFARKLCYPSLGGWRKKMFELRHVKFENGIHKFFFRG